jgi:thiol-disulfide isomerase/thioredoxin
MRPLRPLRRLPLTLSVVLALGLLGQAAAQDAWLDHPLRDAASGETFTLRDYAGAPLLVETMATWCGSCRRQLGNLRDASEMLEAADIPVAYVVISVERGLPDPVLADYAARQAFPFRFAVADDAMLGLLADAFGRGVLNPPSTPHLIVAADGTVGPLRTGFASPDELVALLTAAAP